MPEQLAPMREQVYHDPRPASTFDCYHERVRSHRPNWFYDAVRLLVTPLCVFLFRATCIDSGKVPARGPVVLAPNHFSFMDHFFVGLFVRRHVCFMAKSQLFKPPLAFIYSRGGAFPVRRGAGDEETFITARAILARGGCIVMYPEGGRSRTGEIGDEAKPGIGRLALETGAPIVPVAVHGSARVRNWKRLQFPRIVVGYGDPLVPERRERPTRNDQHEFADRVLAAIKRLYAEVDRRRRSG